MKRLYCSRVYEFYTHLKQILIDLDLIDQDYLWLISDIEAYPQKEKYQELLNKSTYLLFTTKELLDMLEEDDFQWIWAVFSAIPPEYPKEEILKYDLPYVETVEKGKYDPHTDKPRLQHPYSEFELYAVDSSYLFMITDSEEIISKFKKSYPNYEEES